MKKIALTILIIISFLLFIGLIYIAINASNVHKLVKTVGFIIIGYISIILFSFSWFKLFR